MFDREVIPSGLDEMEPGPFLAAILASTDVGRLSGYDRVVVMRARQRMASHYAAHVYGDMAAVADAVDEYDEFDDPELAAETAAAEIRAALRLTRRAADSELAFALDLRDRLPRVWAALAAGDLDLRRAKTIAHSTAHLDAGVARTVVDEIIARAPQLTTGQLRAHLRRLCIDVDPDAAKERFESAVSERRVVSELTEDGTTHLFGLDLAPDRAAAASAHINRLARHLKTSDESRTMDQLRADVFLDLLLGSQKHRNGGGTGGVEIRVDLSTLAGLSEAPGELAGYGPVIADIARQVTDQRAHGSRWRWVVTDPVTGLPVHDGLTRRRPRAGQRRHVEARQPSCVFPGCRMPSKDCDLDHRIPWSEGGPTDVTQLAPLCRHDHRVRHRAGWTYQPLPGGDYQWTTRLGHTYTTSGRSP